MSLFSSSLSGGVVPLTRRLFETPLPAGRKITAGFGYIQRIGKSATYDVWFPDALRQALEAKIAAGLATEDADFPAQWAAVRQIELLQESGNYKIYDLDPGDLKRALRDVSRSMRAGGYRVTVATLGSYVPGKGSDDLEALDTRLQDRIAKLIHMLYMDEASAEANAAAADELRRHAWDFRTSLPHVGMVLGAQDLFSRVVKSEEDEDEEGEKGKRGGAAGGGFMKTPAARRRHRNARKFFDIISQLPCEQIAHDTVIGLQLPESNAENEWPYIADPQETLGAFNRALGSLFDCFNGMSLSRLHGREGAGTEVKASTFHMRSYGHPLSGSDYAFYSNAALSLG